MFCVLVGDVPKVAALWRKRKVPSGENLCWHFIKPQTQWFPLKPLSFLMIPFLLFVQLRVSKVILTLTLVAFSILDNQLTIWRLRREMLVRFSVCSLLRESELETWKISSLLLEKSVNIEVNFHIFNSFQHVLNTQIWFCLQVRDVRIISDRNSRRSKGIAYIEFVETSSVPLAIGLTGQRLLGVPIIVQASQVMATSSVWCDWTH